MVNNVHSRLLHCTIEEAGLLIDGLGSNQDLLWPGDLWPPIGFDRPLAVGAIGGHDSLRYFVEGYEPGQCVLFRFTDPTGFDGTHGFRIQEVALGAVRLAHELSMNLRGRARLLWPLVIRWLHDAAVEDGLDRAKAYASDSDVEFRPWPLRVRLLRRMMHRRKTTPDLRASSSRGLI